jgi:hypothetical protein
VDVALEIWGVVVASLGGSFASFFTSGDRKPGEREHDAVREERLSSTTP